MGRKKKFTTENICYLVYCKHKSNRIEEPYKDALRPVDQITTLAFFITPDQIDNEERILYDRGLKGVFYDFYRIKIINESEYLDYVKLLTKHQHFTYLGSKDVYIL